MNGALLEAFRHNRWATKQLLAFCRDLSEEQLTSPGSGTFGSILATFNHLVLADGRYVVRLASSGPAWANTESDRDENVDLEELEARVDETERIWEHLLSEPFDTERVFVVDNGAYEVRAGVILTQALHHGNAHREQICAILTGFGVQPPDVQAWDYAWATGRIWDRNAAD